MANTYIQRILSAGGSISPNDIGTYGSIIISKYPCEFYECKFNSFMHRSLILAEACVPFHLIVATSHFESLNNAALRCEQLETTFQVLKAAQGEEFAGHSVLVGDFNFHMLNTEERLQIMTEQSHQSSSQEAEKVHEETVILR